MSRSIVDYSGPSDPAPGGRTSPRQHLGRRIVLALVALLLLAGLAQGGRVLWHNYRLRPTGASHALNSGQLHALQAVTPAADRPSQPPAAAAAASPSPTAIPGTAILSVPYTVQAPFNNWKVHEESCEEAALLMYHDYLQADPRTDIPPGEADSALRALKAWQVTNWGAERDLDMEHTGQLAQQYYGYQYTVAAATRDSIMAAIAAGHPVVVPVMTHSLQNPHYGPKSVYHELLVTGYTQDGVVSNDAGVMQGKNWFYSWSVLFGAIDAQTPGMHQGRVMLVVQA